MNRFRIFSKNFYGPEKKIDERRLEWMYKKQTFTIFVLRVFNFVIQVVDRTNGYTTMGRPVEE